MKSFSMKQIRRTIAVVLAMAVLLVSFAGAVPVNAATKGDMSKANVKWDLKNNKKLTYKQYWYSMGAQKHTVKMTKFKVKKASTPGYKQCTFTLTFNMNVNPTDKQIRKMAAWDDLGKLFTQWGFCIVDYKTGMSLGAENDKDVTASWEWNNSKYIKKYTSDGSWIRFPRKSVVKVKIIYPENYKDLCIGVVGASSAKLKTADAHWDGELKFSKATSLYSKKDKRFAHFMRVKK